MTICEIRKFRQSSKRLQILFEGGDSIVLYKGEVRRLGMEEGQEFSPGDFSQICEEILLPRAKKRALHLLEKQDRTRANLLAKLKEGGYPPSVCEAALSYVESYGYVDDLRYAQNYVHFHQEKKSRRRITTDLKQKGVAESLIQIALEEEYTATDREKIAGLLEKKGYDPQEADRKERAKICRFLMGRGFDYEDIKAFL